MADVLLLHGFKGTGTSRFLPSLTARYTANGHRVFSPDLPSPDQPHIDAWTETVRALPVQDFDLIVGYSLGGCLAFSMLSRSLISTRTLAVIGASPGPKDNEHMNTFLNYPLNFDVINERAKKTIVIHSLDDPWTYPEYAFVTLRHTRGTAMLYADKGHFETETLPDDLLETLDRTLVRP